MKKSLIALSFVAAGSLCAAPDYWSGANGMEMARVADRLYGNERGSHIYLYIETKKVKANFPGINMALYFETLGKMNFKDVSSQFEKYSEDFN